VTLPLVLPEVPTAVQAVAEVQDTPLRLADSVPLGSGVRWTFQVVPFQRSARVPDRDVSPTAIHIVAEVQDTPLRLAVGVPDGVVTVVVTLALVRPPEISIVTIRNTDPRPARFIRTPSILTFHRPASKSRNRFWGFEDR
jgi:hypothetical protein